jgi:katanin p60 ATPase-containing subunit A1
LSSDFTVCDNVDLETIYLEFCSYFQIKFGKKPRFVKKVDPNVTKSITTTPPESRQAHAKRRANLKSASHVSTVFPEISVKDIETSQFLRVSSLSPPTHDDSNEKSSLIYAKPMCNEDFYNGHSSDWKEMTEMIFKDVVRRDLCVKWTDVVGQDDAKMIMQESIIFPMKFPQLFNRIQPWKGSLVCTRQK